MADTAPPDQTKSIAIPLSAFAVGAVVALLLGIFGKAHDPSTDDTTMLWFDTVIGMKVAISVVIGVLTIGQVIGALWIYGKLGIKAPSWLGTAHRASGTVALLLAVFVGYHCIWVLGLQSGTVHNDYETFKVGARTLIHGVLGCLVFGAVVVKVIAVRSKRAPGWFLPVAGGLLFTLLIAVVLTSAGWYLNENGWPS